MLFIKGPGGLIKYWVIHLVTNSWCFIARCEYEIVYGQNPFEVFELIFVPRIESLSIQATDMANYLHDIHKQVKQTINGNNVMYKALTDTHYKRVVFEVGD